MVRFDSRAIPSAAREIRAFLVVRNEAIRLPQTLDHHRRLGVRRFFAIDNGSTDGTLDYLLAQPDTHVFGTDASYGDARLGVDWLESLLDEFGKDRWCLLVDADEHLVYPDCERLDLTRFCEALEAKGLNCLATLFIDLYADGAIAATGLRPGQTLLQACPYFDVAGYRHLPARDLPLPRVYGGVRARLFWPEIDLEGEATRAARIAREAFDDNAYLRLHEDVRAAVESGVFPSGLDHFLSYGHREGRAAAVRPVEEWREDAYLDANLDVRDAVRRGSMASGLEHYVRYGQFEARLPAYDWPPRLSQVPLFRWTGGMHLGVGRHDLGGAAWHRNDAVGGALLHFWLLGDLAERALASAHSPVVSAASRSWSTENDR
jgi:hypothetical protein